VVEEGRSLGIFISREFQEFSLFPEIKWKSLNYFKNWIENVSIGGGFSGDIKE
jgi:hypothetical protein